MNKTLTRRLDLDRGAINAAARTIPATLSSTYPVQRDFGEEVLLHTPEAIDMTRAEKGLPLLFNHSRDTIIGRVEGIRLDGNRLRGLLRFSENPQATEVWADFEAGILQDVSIGYQIHDMQQDPSGSAWNITRWQPLELSIVTVPADPHVGIGRSAPNPKLENNMQTQTTNHDEVRDIASIVHRGDKNATNQLTQDFIARGLSLEACRTEALNIMARRDEATPTTNINHGYYGHSIDDKVSAMSEALAARCGGPAPSNAARAYGHMRATDMLRTLLEDRGVSANRMTPSEIVQRAHATSDFPNLLAGAGNRILLNAYAAHNGGIRRIARESTARDFRAKQMLSLGTAPSLKKVNEHGEFNYGSTAEAVETYKLETFGRIFSITRQALVNDDLGAFGDFVNRFGIAANELENSQIVSLLTSNPVMSDGVALFHANHGNLAGTAAAISVASLGAARKAMRLQKGLDGTTPIDCTPAYLIVPAALETVAEQFLATLSPTVATDTNPFSGRLELVVDPRLNAISATAWYLAARPEIVPTIEYSYLEGYAGPVIETRSGFEVDGLEIKCRLDFGCGVLDWRGMFKNAGA